MNFPAKGLYAITPHGLSPPALIEQSALVLAGGAVWLQYRAKPRPDRDLARRLASMCHRAGALLIVNDDPGIAVAAGADGVHLGRDDPALAGARAVLGPDRIIGVSCYDDLDRARRLATCGADYLAFGSVYPSSTKPDAVRCRLETLARARSLGKPVVAIGGITLDRAPEVIAAGADLLAVVADLFGAADIRDRAARYARLFQTGRVGGD